MFKRAGAVAMILGLLPSACGETRVPRQTSAETLPYPVDQASVAGRGFPLFDGWVVEGGSWLLGAPFPTRNTPVPDSADSQSSPWYGWTAYFALTVDPAEAAAAYLEQGADLGFEYGDSEPRCRDDSCMAHRRTAAGETKEERGGALAMEVFATAEGEESSDWPKNILILDIGGYGYTESPIAAEDTTDVSKSSDTPLTPAGSLPDTGDRVGGIQFAIEGHAARPPVWLTIAQDSRLIAPAVVWDEGERELLGPALTVLMKLTDDDLSARESYAAEVKAHYAREVKSETWQLGGQNVIERVLECGGCGTYRERVITTLQGEAYLAIELTTRN